MQPNYRLIPQVRTKSKRISIRVPVSLFITILRLHWIKMKQVPRKYQLIHNRNHFGSCIINTGPYLVFDISCPVCSGSITMVCDERLILSLILTTLLVNGLEDWQTFKHKYKKKYSNSALEAQRQLAFNKHKELINQHNQGKETFKLGLSEYSDIPHDQFVKSVIGLRPQRKDFLSVPSSTVDVSKLPASVDWRTTGFVTPVKNQGQCASSWAFSAVAAMEFAVNNATDMQVSLSEQNLIDCAGIFYGNYGCTGGMPDNAYAYVRKNNGIDTETCYPFIGVQWLCRYNSTCRGGSCSGHVGIPSGSETALQNAVATEGVASATVDASHVSFQLYKSGVYREMACNSTAMNHAVAVVGYGTDSTAGDYWIVKNSWGTSWGEQGYIRMSRNNNNNCGIATLASYPTV